MPHIEIYTKASCGFCHRAKALLDSKQVTYEEISLDRHPERRQEMVERSHRQTVPQIFIDGESIGGCDDLYALDNAGKLDERLK